MVVVDVLEDGGIEERGLVGRFALDLFAQLSGADVVVEIGEDEQIGFVARGV